MTTGVGASPDRSEARQDWVRRERRRRKPNRRWRRGIFARRREVGATGRRSLTSRALHRMGRASAHAATGLSAAAFVLAWTAYGIATGFPPWWETVLYSVSSSATLIMVFTLQHMQSRLDSATQRKLDELVRAMPRADDQLIAVEEAPDDELAALTELNQSERSRLLSRNRAASSHAAPDSCRS